MSTSFLRVCSVVILCFLSVRQVSAQQIVSGGPLDTVQANMDIRHYRLSLSVEPDRQRIEGDAEVSLVLLASAREILLDLVPALRVSRVTLDGKNVPFKHDGESLMVRSAVDIAKGEHRVRVWYGGQPPVARRAPWEGGFQWEKDSLSRPWVAISCQGEGGKIYFPCKDHPSDEPDNGADLHIRVPKGLMVAGPGLLQSARTHGRYTTFHWKTTYPISNYGILFNVAHYRVVSREYTTIAGKRVPMQFYVLDYHADEAPHQLEMLERSARVQEKYFGEYPWPAEKIGIAETPHLGMEHQTMNAYGNKFRYTNVGGQDFDWLMHHEFGHEWWGNKVTNKDWAHMWIQEGICVFGDALYIREMEGEDAYRARMRQTARASRNEKPIVQGEVIDAKQTYHPDIYGKAAFFMHTLRYIMGDSSFFPTLKQLATDPKYTYLNMVTTADLEALFSSAYGQSLSPVFYLFLRTTDKLDVQVKEVDEGQYLVRMPNAGMSLPIDVQTERGIERHLIPADGLRIASRTVPVIDPIGFYLKQVTIR
jgi:aminopeptidase N